MPTAATIPEIARFEAAFSTFVAILYGDDKWRYEAAERQASYQAVFDALLLLLAARGIAYDDFVEQELTAWATPPSAGNPLALPFTQAFLPLYESRRYKDSFLIICLQSREPAKDISTALLHACYCEVQGKLDGCFGISTWLDFLGNYPNPEAVRFIAFIMPFINDDWYGQDLAAHLPYVLQVNPGPAATALLAEWEALEALLDAARRV
jgi:hypothetical protein